MNNGSNDILNILGEIEIMQNNIKNLGVNPCEQELGINQYIYNTIPIMFICKKNCNWFIGSGLFKDSNDTFKCLQTPIFRVTKVDQDKKLVLLELLQPQTRDGKIAIISCKNSVCNFFSSALIKKIIRTNIYIKIGIDSFSGIECLDSIYAKKGIPVGTIDDSYKIDVETSEYVTISDGIKKVYFNNDGINQFNIIPSPFMISYFNLFINGMLQPPTFYNVEEGKLTLTTQDVPISGTYIILQSIIIKKFDQK